MRLSSSKYTKMHLRPGLHPGLHWGSLQRSLGHHSWITGRREKGRERGDGEKERVGGGGKRGGEGGREGSTCKSVATSLARASIVRQRRIYRHSQNSLGWMLVRSDYLDLAGFLLFCTGWTAAQISYSTLHSLNDNCGVNMVAWHFVV